MKKCGWTGFLQERVAQDVVGKRRRVIRFDNPPLCEAAGKGGERVAKAVQEEAELRSVYAKTEPLTVEHSAAVQRILESFELERLNVETLRHFGARIWRTTAAKSKRNSDSTTAPQTQASVEGKSNQETETETIRIVLPLRTFVANSSTQLAKVTHFVCLDELVAFEETGERKPTLYSAQLSELTKLQSEQHGFASESYR